MSHMQSHYFSKRHVDQNSLGWFLSRLGKSEGLKGGFTMHYIHPCGHHMLHPMVSIMCQHPFLILFRPGMLHCGLCLPKGGPHVPVNVRCKTQKLDFCVYVFVYVCLCLSVCVCTCVCVCVCLREREIN